MTTVTREEHLKDVIEGNRYPDTWLASSSLYRCVWIPVTFHDFTEGVLLLLPWSHPERQFVPCERGALSQAQTVVLDMTTVIGEVHLE